MNISKFASHIASRKCVPVGIELKESVVSIPPVDLNLKCVKNKLRGPCSLQKATVLSCDLDGDRQWLRLSFRNEFCDESFLSWYNASRLELVSGLDGASVPCGPCDTLLLSRFRRAFGGKERVPLRLWEMDGGVLRKYSGSVSEGSIVICSFEELRAYVKGGDVKVVGDLHRDIVVVRESNKRRRVIYFPDE